MKPRDSEEPWTQEVKGLTYTPIAGKLNFFLYPSLVPGGPCPAEPSLPLPSDGWNSLKETRGNKTGHQHDCQITLPR